jgi:hypothetical protein
MRGCRSGQTGWTQDPLAQCLRRFESFSPHTIAPVAQSGLEHQGPNLRVEGSNPFGRVDFHLCKTRGFESTHKQSMW